LQLCSSALAQRYLTVHVEKAGSREIAHRFDPQHFDFGFPSGAPAAAALQATASGISYNRTRLQQVRDLSQCPEP